MKKKLFLDVTIQKKNLLKWRCEWLLLKVDSAKKMRSSSSIRFWGQKK